MLAGSSALLALARQTDTEACENGFRTSAAPRIQSIAVLTLEKISAAPSKIILLTAMTEALITDLGKIGEIFGGRVFAPNPFGLHYKGTRKTLPENRSGNLNVDA